MLLEKVSGEVPTDGRAERDGVEMGGRLHQRPEDVSVLLEKPLILRRQGMVDSEFFIFFMSLHKSHGFLQNSLVDVLALDVLSIIIFDRETLLERLAQHCDFFVNIDFGPTGSY